MVIYALKEMANTVELSNLMRTKSKSKRIESKYGKFENLEKDQLNESQIFFRANEIMEIWKKIKKSNF